MNIKLRIKLKEIKDNLIESWYSLMTPIANAITKEKTKLDNGQTNMPCKGVQNLL